MARLDVRIIINNQSSTGASRWWRKFLKEARAEIERCPMQKVCSRLCTADQLKTIFLDDDVKKEFNIVLTCLN